MKKLIQLIVIASVCSACSFSVGTNKNLMNGLSYTYNGFAVDNVLLAGPDNTVLNTNEVALNTKIAIVVEGLVNYELKDNKANPGLALRVTAKDGTDIINEADLFSQSEGYSAEDAAVLRGTVTVGDPMRAGETYHVTMKVWDKNKPENELTAEVDLIVK